MNMGAVVAVKIWKDPIEVDNRLEELGLTADELLEVIEAMIGARAGCTDNDPPGSRGWSSYRMGTRRLREVKCSQENWAKDDADQIASVLNTKRCIRVAVANTDDGTGIDDPTRYPQNRAKKGAATDRVVQLNQQLSFMGALDESMKVVALRIEKVSGTTTWYLCVYSDGDEHRAELSWPVALDGGFFTDFKERILIDTRRPSGGPARKRNVSDGDGSDFDIPVKRKRP